MMIREKDNELLEEGIDEEFDEDYDESPTDKKKAFHRYCSIENVHQAQVIELIMKQGHDLGEWVAVEKVHGANLCFIIDKTEIKVAKRTAVLEAKDKAFFNYKMLLEKYSTHLRKLFEIVCAEDDSETGMVRVYGEIFGGEYPHKAVAPVQGAIRVQGGVFYCPHNEFYAFDIHSGMRFLDFDRTLHLFKTCGLFHAEPIFRGSFAEVMKVPHTFVTTIPQKLNLPPLEGAENIAEGLVLKPVTHKCFFNGQRIILKNKTAKFLEKKSLKPRKEPKIITTIPLSEPAKVLAEHLHACLNINRLNAVISKIGEVSPNDIGKLTGLLSGDAFKDFKKDHGVQFDALSEVEKKELKKQIGKRAERVVLKYFNMVK